MSDFFSEFERDKLHALARIRHDVGWPEDHEYEHLGADLMWRYIEALENALTAERRLPYPPA